MKHRIPPGAPGHPLEDSRAARSGRDRSARDGAAAGGESRNEARGRDSAAGTPPRKNAAHSQKADSKSFPRNERRAGPLTRGSQPGGRPRPGPFRAVEFIYEDESIVAVAKPEGLPVIAPEGSRGANLYDIITEHIRKSNPKGRAAVVHRIDRDTSGLVVFAKSAVAKRLLMGAWDEIVRERRYLALVEGAMETVEGRRESYLVENRAGMVYEAPASTRGARRAATRWRALASGSGLSLVELRLETGRKHQIRVQLAALGHPVAGDERYGSHLDPLGRLCLHAELIELALPGRREPLVLRCPAPTTFRAALGAASNGAALGPAARAAASPDRGLAPGRRAASEVGAASSGASSGRETAPGSSATARGGRDEATRFRAAPREPGDARRPSAPRRPGDARTPSASRELGDARHSSPLVRRGWPGRGPRGRLP